MAKIHDFKTADRALYSAPSEKPVVLEIPSLPFVLVRGAGDPNAPPFARACAALYGFSYALRMSEKSGDAPEGFSLFTVAPLEGHWTVAEGTAFDPADKSNLRWILMIRQPAFLNRTVFESFREKAQRKAQKKGEANEFLDALEFSTQTEGLCAQILHRGPYSDEPATFALMENHLATMGYRRTSLDHREIYLSAPGRVEPLKMKTLLRVSVAQL